MSPRASIVIILTILFFILIVLVAMRASGLGHSIIRGGAAPKNRFPPKVRAVARAHPEWGTINYDLFETAPGKVSWYSSLMPWHVPDVDRALHAEFPEKPPQTITDATAHIGADSANFLKLFPHAIVTAIEIDHVVGAVLRRNASRVTSVLRLPICHFHAITADARVYLRTRVVSDEVVYFDPPWAPGPDSLRLGEPLAATINEVLERGTRVVIVKLPRETDLDAFDKLVGRISTRHSIRNLSRPDMPLSYYLMSYRKK